MDNSQVFSGDQWRPVTMALFLAVLVTITTLATKRTPDSVAKWRAASATSLAISFTLIDSLVFVGVSSFIVFGLGSSRSLGVCSLARYMCTFFYIGAKLTTAWFLIERVRLVTNPLVPRLKNKLYLFNLALPSMWVSGLVVALLFHTTRIRRSDGECLIGLSTTVLGTLMGIEIFLNTYYTSLFVVPLLRGKWTNPRLKRLAIHSALAAVLTVSSSLANLAVFASHHGVELSWVCLATCTLDTVWCAVVLCALTGKRDDDHASDVGSRSQTGATTAALWRRTVDGPKSLGADGLPLRSHASHNVADDQPGAGWGGFGQYELSEAGARARAAGRGSNATEQLCFAAGGEGKVAGRAWKSPSLKDEGSEEEVEEEGKEVEVEVEEEEGTAEPRVGFAVMLDKGDAR